MKTYYLNSGSISQPGSLCSGIPGDPAFYAPVNTKEIRWVRVEELREWLVSKEALEAGAQEMCFHAPPGFESDWSKLSDDARVQYREDARKAILGAFEEVIDA